MDRLGFEKVFYHVDQMYQFTHTGDTYPVHVQVGLTSFCNYRCVFCHSDYETANPEKNEIIRTDCILKFLKAMREKGTKAITFIGTGEPLLHPDIIKILDSTKEMGFELGIFSNGSRMPEPVRQAILRDCTFIRFSVNAADADEHERVHQKKGDFENVIGNISELVEQKRRLGSKLPTIGAQFVFFEGNYRSIGRAAKMWKEIGVDYFEVKPMIEQEANETMPRAVRDTEAVKKLFQEAREYMDDRFEVYTKSSQYELVSEHKERKYGACYGQAFAANILADGKMYPCANMEFPEYIIGDIYKNTFEEIWNSEHRKKLLDSIDVSNCPVGCRCHLLNEILWDFKNPDPLIHPNFI